jgi:signal transduction histidine kinase
VIADLSPQIQGRIDAERVRLYYRQLHLAIAYNVGALVLVGITLWYDAESRAALLGWIAAMLAIQAGRIALAISFERAQPGPEQLEAWRRAAIVSGSIAGLGWAATAVVILRPEDPFNLMIVIATAAGVVAGGAAIMTALPEAYFAHMAAHVSGLAIALAAQGTVEAVTLAVGTLAFGGLMLAIARIGKKSIEESLRLRFQRIDMIDRLEAARAQAESASQAKSEFLTLMTHELRTPLNSIIGYAELITSIAASKRTDKLDAYAKDIHDGARHLLALINDILDLSKADAGTLDMQEGLFDIVAAVERCRRTMAPLAEESDVDLKVEITAPLPAFRGDERLIRQAVINLVSNAIKFTPSGGAVHVGVARLEAGGIAVAVVDTGIGMSPEDIPRAFEPFQQLDHGIRRERQGSGLGLPLAKRFAELHGGSIEIASRPGRGTTVRLILPAERVVS